MFFKRYKLGHFDSRKLLNFLLRLVKIIDFNPLYCKEKHLKKQAFQNEIFSEIVSIALFVNKRNKLCNDLESWSLVMYLRPVIEKI